MLTVVGDILIHWQLGRGRIQEEVASTLVQCCLQLFREVLGKSRKHSILGWYC